MKNYATFISLVLLAACSPKAPSEQDVAEMLTAGSERIPVNRAEISKLNCKKSDDQYHCEFMLYGKPKSMTVVQVGHGNFSWLR